MSLPQTGFEQRNRDGAWTTFEEEATYFADLLTAVPSIREEVIGQGHSGLDLKMYKVGSGARHVLISAQMHAAELAGREALLSLIRDWATDPGMESYLEQVTILAIPTMRPDSQTERNPPNGVSINTDNVRLVNPETRALQRVFTQYSPEVGVDVHEAVNATADLETSASMNPNLHPGIASLSGDLEQAVKSAIEGADWQWGPYWSHTINGGEFTNNSYSLRHAVGILLESRRRSAGGNLIDTERRHEVQMIGLNGVLEWHEQNFSQVQQAHQASREAAEGTAEVFYPAEGWGEPYVPVAPAPSGYVIAESDRHLLDYAVEVFGLPEIGGDGLVSAGHAERSMIHYLVDPASPQRVATGVRRHDDSAPTSRATPPSAPRVFYKTGGVVYPARFTGRQVGT